MIPKKIRMTIREAIEKLVNRINLSEAETIEVMNQIMTGEASPLQVAAFLTALRMKGESVEEITGAARVMREKAHRVNVGAKTVLDTCGTGGDQKGTFNISTTAAFVLAGAGVNVAKHGNRSVSSQSGSADVLAALGVKVDAPKERVEQCIARIGIGFLFAPLLHEAMKYAVQPRRDIGIRTIFNILGPLTNPALATHQLIGIYNAEMVEMIARVLKNLGSARAMVVHGLEGLDEISLCGPTKVAELRDGEVKEYSVEPEQFGLKRCRLEELHGGNPEQSAVIVRGILEGAKGSTRDVVLLNSGAALCVSGKAATIQDGIRLAGESIDSGKARQKLAQLVEMTNAA
jgi:anthranilate phosphoribosyltransferase